MNSIDMADCIRHHQLPAPPVSPAALMETVSHNTDLVDLDGWDSDYSSSHNSSLIQPHDGANSTITITSSTTSSSSPTLHDTTLNNGRFPFSLPQFINPTNNNNNTKHGTLTLIGAGPGDPSLLTLAALFAIQSADLLILDQLMPPPFLRFIQSIKPTSAEIRFVPKPGKPFASTTTTTTTTTPIPKTDSEVSKGQQRLHEWISDAILNHQQHVVRLKNGDVALLARSIEEIQALFEAFETKSKQQLDIQLPPNVIIIPGVSSSFASGWAAGVPLTHRGLANQVTISTGHVVKSSQSQKQQHSTHVDSEPTPPKLPIYNPEATLVLLMAVKALPKLTEWMTRSIESGGGGYPLTTPAVIVAKATCSSQNAKSDELWFDDEYVDKHGGNDTNSGGHVIRTVLRDLAGCVLNDDGNGGTGGIQHHATIIIGRVVGAMDPVADILKRCKVGMSVDGVLDGCADRDQLDEGYEQLGKVMGNFRGFGLLGIMVLVGSWYMIVSLFILT
ncbi:hypothetical protein HDU76_010671 [Blyttiomyces sp. JEL0837]|nr:hypothetical protein HDU76_010671 [Blyttiomyces sp. JEL0837]